MKRIKPDFSTQVIHAGEQHLQADNAIFPPIYTSSTFVKRNLDDRPEFAYGRVGNPTRHAYESSVAALEGGSGAVACASGMAATALVMELLPKDSHVIVMSGVYGGTFRLLENYRSLSSGIQASYVNLNDLDAVAAAVRGNTRLIWIETPTNPLLELVDLALIAEFARFNEILSCVDNTFCSPWNQRPINYGIDLVMHSASKYISGHSDLIGGLVVAADSQLASHLKSLAMALGGVQGPFDCYLGLRGLKTLDVRMERQCANALRLARWLQTCPQVEQVFYPGLPSHPQHALCQQQMRTGGAVVSMKINASREQINCFVERLKLFMLADSLGGVESMINHSSSMSHCSLSTEQKTAMGITENLLRLSIGIEHADDLIADLEQAFCAIISHEEIVQRSAEYSTAKNS